MQHKDIKIVRKTTKVYELIFKKDGISKDITDWSIYFVAKANVKDTDANAEISKTITTHSAPTSGITLITLDPSDTDIDAGNYYYSIDFKDDKDQEGVVLHGKLRIIEPVRKTRG